MISSKNNGGSSNRIIRNLSLGAFVRDAGQYVIWVIMTVYLNEVRSLSFIDIGIIFMLAGLVSVPVSIMGGNLLDRFGRRSMAVVIPWIMCAISFSLFLLLYSNSEIIPIIGLFIIAGPIQSLQYVTMSSIISDVTSNAERISGFSALRIASNVGIGVGLVLGGFLSQLNYSYVFLMSVAGYAVEGTIYYLQIPETSKSITSGYAVPAEGNRIFIPYRDGFFIAIAIMTSITWFFTGMFESALTPLYMSSVNHYDTFSITMLFAINTAVVIFGQRPVNLLLTKIRDSRRIIVGLVLYATAYMVFAGSSVYLIIGLAVVLLTIGENMTSPATESLITKIAPEDKRGAYLGFNSSIASLINPFRPIFGTVLLADTVKTPSFSWVAISLISIGFAIIFLMVFRSMSSERKDSGLNQL